MKKFIQAGKYQAAYTVTGTGKPLVLLHGFFGNSSTLSQLAEHLQSEFQCFSLELLGFGDSAKPKINYLIDDQVEFLKGFTEALNIKNFHLVGYSYGAWVASAYAIQHQANLKSLGLVAPAGIRDDSFAGNYDHLKPLLWKTKLVDLAIALYKPLAHLRGDKSGYKKIAQARRALMTQPAAAAMLKSRMNPEDAIDTVEKYIHNISLKTVIIAAENDTTIPRWHSETYAEKIPQTEFHVVAESDHDFVETHAQEIGVLLKGFLTKSALEQTMMPHD